MSHNAIMQQRRDSFDWEAMRICNERELGLDDLPRIAAALRHRAFTDAIQPILKAKADVMMCAMPTMLLRPSQSFAERVDDGLTEGQRKALATADALIMSIAEGFGYNPLTAEDKAHPSTSLARS